jgi:septal ring factor EnvC (AmiA/AmiB activator)
MPEKALTDYATGTPTRLQARFADWLLDKTGVKPGDEGSFRDGVRLATSLRMQFQRSEENKAATAAEKEERAASLASTQEEREKAAAERQAKAEERAKKAEERAAAAKAKAAEQLAKAEERAAALRAKAEGKATTKPSKKGKKAAEETVSDTPDEVTTSPEGESDQDGDEAPW